MKRSYTTRLPRAYGTVAIEVVDEKGKPVPVRMGIYDSTGRMPLPNDEAVPLRTFNGISRIVPVRAGSTMWPVKNHSVFYVDGAYHPTLPVGNYEVIVAKGPEYRITRRALTVAANKTMHVELQLHRWTDMGSKGWYSGDGHIHYGRNSASDDRGLLLFTEGEGLNVGNILQMGNSGAAHYLQYGWHAVSNANRSTFVLVPGQEDPRTARLGHTIHLNIKEPIRDPARYLLYDETFAKARAQGGVTGYAHGFGQGMVLDVPAGLVDFVEVLQGGGAGVQFWFDFLNLGYKLVPIAGTDYPYIDIPGAVRNYVYVGQEFSPGAWFDALKEGRTFVTNGPMLELSINQQGMGEELHVKPGETLSIKARATINPDIDPLEGMELVEQGEVIKRVSSAPGAMELKLEHTMSARQGSWFVLRAVGKRQDPSRSILALSAPVYVLVDGQSFWKRSAVPDIVARIKKQMPSTLTVVVEGVEGWETHEPDARYWEAQKPRLQQRIDQAKAMYDDLVRRASSKNSGTNATR